MLIKRTNILFEKKTWEMLTTLSQQKGDSVGELVRRAVKKTYFSEGERMVKNQVFNQIVSLRKKLRGKIDYQRLIEDGRKY